MFNLIYEVWYGLIAVVAIGFAVRLLVKQWQGWRQDSAVDKMIGDYMKARAAAGKPITHAEAKSRVLEVLSDVEPTHEEIERWLNGSK
jgi:hypothetical protein